MNYKRKPVTKLSGNEVFVNTGSLRFKVSDLWGYAFSNLNSNILRGSVAEFLVEMAFHGPEAAGIRNPWEDYDVQTTAGKTIEVKSCSYLQDWDQEKLSSVIFSGLKAGSVWPAAATPEQAAITDEKRYKADIYVLALLHHQFTETLNILDLEQWSFYVLSREGLAEAANNGNSITLVRLQRYSVQPVSFVQLKAAIEALQAE